MKFAVRGETLVERMGLWMGLVPEPLFDTHIAVTLARAVMAGVELELFEALEAHPLGAAEIARRCATDPRATVLLLDALVASGYLVLAGETYALARKSRRWLLRSSRNSLRDKLLLQAIEWEWLTHLEEFVRTGRPLNFHSTMSEQQLGLYHRSMRAIAGIAGREVGWRTPVPRNATRMLDIGGSHGHFASAICRNHPDLTADVLDLPEAVRNAAPLLAKENLADRVVHVEGNAIHADLGVATYDLVLMSNLAHHLTDAQNAQLATRVARALRGGGMFVLQEAVRPSTPNQAGQTGTLLGLYFALQSNSDVTSWTTADMCRWQTCAGLRLFSTRKLLTAPGWVQQAATKAA